MRRGPERRPGRRGDEREAEDELQFGQSWFFGAVAAHFWRCLAFRRGASDSARGCVSLALARYFGTRLTCRYVFSALCGAFREIKALGRRGRLGASVKRAGAVPGAPRYAVVRR